MTDNNTGTKVRKAQFDFENMNQCIDSVVEEENVTRETAAEICRDMREDSGEAPQFGQGSSGYNELQSDIISPQVASQNETLDLLELDLGGENTRMTSLSSIDEEIGNMAVGSEEQERIIRVAQRKPGESRADCISRVMREDEVDRETAAEACAEIAGEEE